MKPVVVLVGVIVILIIIKYMDSKPLEKTSKKILNLVESKINKLAESKTSINKELQMVQMPLELKHRMCNASSSINNLYNFKIDKKVKNVLKSASELSSNKFNLNLDNVPPTLDHDDLTYTLFGTANNIFYNQHYVLYENEINDETNNFNLYKYLLVNIKNTNIDIKLTVGPRQKISINDVVYLSSGQFQVGPLVINNI